MSAHTDATFLRMFMAVLGALVAFTVIILIAANFIGSALDESMTDDPMRRAAVERRIAPIGQVQIAGEAQSAAAVPAATAPAAEATPTAAPRSGEQVYQLACLACHSTGAAGAPKVGDKAAWQPRVAQGLDNLVGVVIAGKGAMPARGGNPTLTDEEIRASIVYMLDQTGMSVSAGESAQPPSGQTVDQGKPQPQASMSATGPAPGTEAAPQVVAQPKAAPDVVTAAVATTPATVTAMTDAPTIDLVKGQEIYQVACLACHMSGAAGAPKLGDVTAWAPRIAQGSEVLLHSAIHGKGAMPPKGGRVDLSDADVTAAVAYMVKESQ